MGLTLLNALQQKVNKMNAEEATLTGDPATDIGIG
jgi:hypothetical protein